MPLSHTAGQVGLLESMFVRRERGRVKRERWEEGVCVHICAYGFRYARVYFVHSCLVVHSVV